MYLSRLLIDIGKNPDRPRPGRLWIKNPYRVHQRLCMAFPSNSRVSKDPHFLKPFNPEDFACNHVHVKRNMNAGFLFRIDPNSYGRVVIIVQSALKPNWEYAFHNAEYLLAAKLSRAVQVKEFEPDFKKDQMLRFRLLVNPTRRLSKNSPDKKKDSIGKRVPVPNDRLIDWLKGRGEKGGFSLEDTFTIRTGYVYINKPKFDAFRLRSVLYEGILKVTDPSEFCKTIVSGIGSGKAFGFGLFSVKPVDLSHKKGKM